MSTSRARARAATIAAVGLVLALTANTLPSLAVQAATGVTRESGINRFATAAAISKKNFSAGVNVVYIANGVTGLVDALAAGPSAAKQGGPTLLVNPSSIPAETKAELDRLNPKKIVVAGGTSVISSGVEAQLAAYVAAPAPTATPSPTPPPNGAPVAADDAATVDEDSVANAIGVLANDTDPDGDALTVQSVTQPANGAVAIASGGASLTYTPDADFTGSDPFTYTVRDPDGATDTATVALTVTDLPDNQPPVAAADSLEVVEGCTLVVRVLGNDTDPEDLNAALRVTDAADGSKGAVVIVNHALGGLDVPRAVAYTASGPLGADSFTYTVSDSEAATAIGTVNVTVIGSAGDTDMDGTPNECDPFGSAASATVQLDFDGAAGGDWQDAGFTGIMTNSLTDPSSFIDTDAGLSGSGQWVDPSIAEGDAFNGGNDQENGFLVAFTPPAGNFAVHGVVCAPFPTQQFSSAGIFFGAGDQDNYIKAVVNTQGGGTAVHDAREVNGDGFGVSTKPDATIASATCVDLYLTVNKAAATYSPAYSVDGGTTRLGFGGNTSDRTVPAAWLDSSSELAIGIISTSQGPADEFAGTWELLEVTVP